MTPDETRIDRWFVRGAPREDPTAGHAVVRRRPRPREWIAGEAVDEGSRWRSGGGPHRGSRACRGGRAAHRVARRSRRRRDLFRGPQPAGRAGDRARDQAYAWGGPTQQASPAGARAPAPGCRRLSPTSGWCRPHRARAWTSTRGHRGTLPNRLPDRRRRGSRRLRADAKRWRRNWRSSRCWSPAMRVPWAGERPMGPLA